MNGLLLLTALGAALGIYLLLRTRTVCEHKEESLYQTVHVERRGAVRFLRFDSRGWHGAMHLKKKHRLLFPYQQAFLLVTCLLPKVCSFLAIGVGTGTALRTVRRLYPNAHLVGVDIDEVVIRVALRFFQGPKDARTKYVANDGRRYVEETEESFDLVFLDAYADDQIPARMETVEFVRALKARLAAGGVVAVNVIGALRGRESRYLRQVWRTYQEVFSHVALVPTTPFGWEHQNLLLIASDRAFPSRQAIGERVSGSTLFNLHKRRLNRLLGRMVLTPPWDVAGVEPLTDEDVRLYRHRIESHD
jgi:spermidine synthase